jgi:hypothetical protein
MTYYMRRTTDYESKAPEGVNTVGARPERARETGAGDCPVEATAGSRTGYSLGMFDYIVMLEQQPESYRGRREVYEGGIARSMAFRRKLAELLKRQDLCNELGALGEPLAVPAVTLTCTPKLANLIASLPGVKSVTRDSRDIQVVR